MAISFIVRGGWAAVQEQEKNGEATPYKVYVKVDQNGHVISVNSSLFIDDISDWIEVDEGYGDKYCHAQGNYFSKKLRTEKGAFRYRMTNGILEEFDDEDVKKQEEEIEANAKPTVSKAEIKSQMKKAVQLFAMTLPEETALEIPYVYDSWEVGRKYVVNEYLIYGTNNVGDPQLYKVVQAHTSQADWCPDTQPALYTAIGLDETGYAIWAQPTGAQDAYNKDDVVNYNGILYKSLINGNVWSPDVYPSGWELFNE